MADGSLEIADQRAGARRDGRDCACPGLFRIVAARDGGICRIKLPLGHLSGAEARAVAEAAARFGNGIIEATNRANLQIRGVRAGCEAALSRRLVRAGLGPTRPEADDSRNVMVSPTAGIDPLQEIDVRPVARDLLTLMESAESCRVLSPKFCLLVDGREGVATVAHPHDVWLASMAGGARMALGFAGVPPTEAGDETPFVAVGSDRAVAAVATALALFAEEARRDPEVTRFRHLFERISRARFFTRLAERLPGGVERGAQVVAWRRRTPAPLGHVGVKEQRRRGLAFVGAVPPLGRLSPGLLVRLAEIAEGFGDGGIRLTPWQSMIVPGIRREHAQSAVDALEGAGLICDPAHPLASIVACAGMTGCARSLSDTKADALSLATALGPTAGAPRSIHLSGCARSCACAGVADVTLLASAPGRYQLFVAAGDRSSRFGRPLADGVRVPQAAECLREMASTQRAAAGGGRG